MSADLIDYLSNKTPREIKQCLEVGVMNAIKQNRNHIGVSGLGFHASERAHDSLLNEAILRQPLRQMPSKINRQALR